MPLPYHGGIIRCDYLFIFDSLGPTWTIDVLIPKRLSNELHLLQYSGVSLVDSSLGMITLSTLH